MVFLKSNTHQMWYAKCCFA